MFAAQSRKAKFLILRMLRLAGLLEFADSVKFVWGRVKAWPSNLAFHKRNPGFAVPPRHLAFDALNHVNWETYRRTGLQHAGLFARLIREHGTAGAPLEVLEWGCGPGRLVRHIKDLLPGIDVRVTGSDYNPESVAWCRQNLPGIRFVENGLNPPLALPDASFDVVYSFSVVTHLSEPVQLAWLKELQRVLKPGGLLICTTHGDEYRHLLASRDELEAYDAGRIVVQGKYEEGKKWFVAIHPEPFVRERLLDGLADVRRVAALPEDGILQDVWVGRKKETAAQPAPAAMQKPAPARVAGAPRFSIIMNVCDGRHYLHEALASVFAQTFEDWELIFWDDQSKDDSASVLRAFPADSRVRYFRVENRVPLTTARRDAIAQAKGEWLAFLDQDDIWTADKLAKQMRVIDAEDDNGKLGLVYGRAMCFGDVGLVRDFDRHHEFRDLPEGDIFEELFLSSCFICQSASCMRTEYVRKLGEIPAEYLCCSDYYLNTELSSLYSTACTQDIVCWYRVHSQAMSSQYYTQVMREVLAILERWKHRVEPTVYLRHFRIHSAILGVGEITSGENVSGGVMRILRDGSIPYLLSRPFSMAHRVARRAMRYAMYGVAKRPRYT